MTSIVYLRYHAQRHRVAVDAGTDRRIGLGNHKRYESEARADVDDRGIRLRAQMLFSVLLA
jgi:hypothetical protein